jgi:urease accessory protein
MSDPLAASPEPAPPPAPPSLVSLLHLCDSLFPIGGFAHSDGLETAAVEGRVAGVEDLRAWVGVVLGEGLRRLDGPAVLLAWRACRGQRWIDLGTLDQEVHAIRPSSSGRAASRAMGTRLLRTWREIQPASNLDAMPRSLTLPVAFGAVCASGGIPARTAVEGFIYTRLSATISAAMRLMPIGQREAHALLASALRQVPAIVDAVESAASTTTVLGAFAPAFDLAAMAHQHVRSRLFLS